MQSSEANVDNALSKAYRSAFADYARKLDTLRGLIDSDRADRDQIERATVEVEKSRLAYNETRDRFANELVRLSAHKPSHNGNSGSDEQVRRTARLLWEVAGRPDGTAERDWQRAECLVRTPAISHR
jgi:hypothetical protein